MVIQKANYLVEKLGYDVTIITTDQKCRPIFFPISPKVNLVDLEINYYDNRLDKLWHLKKMRLKRKHYKTLIRHLQNNKYDVVVSMMDFDFSFLYKINDGSKKILECHLSKYSKVYATRNRLIKLVQLIRARYWEKVVSKYDKFIVLTEEDRDQWGNIENMNIIPNFIKKIPVKRALLKNKRVISVGRADFQKGFDMLIDSWSIVIKYFPEWVLTIVGGGDKRYLQHKIDDLHLEDSIKLLPPNPNIEKEYLDSSLYVMSSRYEGLPLVLLEAMSYGLPIVSFSCPCGPRDVLKPSFSSLVECYNVEQLAESIKQWLTNEELRIKAGKEAKEEAKKYSIAHIMAKWDELFKSYEYESKKE